MKRLTIFLFSVALHAANYYVASATSNPAGSDSNAGSVGAPWLTLGHAVASISCGDTVNIMADGNYVNGDFTIPYFSGCGLTTTIQSSKLSQFAPVGYRTNPTNDAGIYGKLTFTSGIQSFPERHGAYGGCTISSIVGSTITLGFCNSPMSVLANGFEVYLEINNSAALGALTLPSPFTIFTKYYVVGCSSSPACGTAGSSLGLSATSGGAAMTPGSCTGSCNLGAIVFNMGFQVTAGSGTLTSPDEFTAITNGTPVALSAAGLQAFGTLPTGFSLNTVYYVVNRSGNSFGLAPTLGGTAIVPSDIGSGALILATTNAPHNWSFRGLEDYAPGPVTAIFALGSGAETSTLGMVSNMEIDRNWLHGDPTACPSSGPTRGVADNGINTSIHDSYFGSFCTGEGQAIVAYGSQGSNITNNFLEAAAENTMSGGLGNSSGISVSHRTFTGNYYYKPPVWKITTNTGAASGPCWYDNTDPFNTGGEWYRDTAASQNYQCGSNGMWATTSATLPVSPTIKNMAEYKDGSYHTYIGNVFNYSWVGGQSGQAVAMHQGEDSGPGRANDHALVKNNKVLHAYQFTTEQSHCNTTTIYCAVFPTVHQIINNLAILDGEACGVAFSTGSNSCGYIMHDSNADGYPPSAGLRMHNTVVLPDGATSSFPPPGYGAVAFFGSPDSSCNPAVLPFGTIDAMTYKNNITGGDFQGDCYAAQDVFANYFTHAAYTNNVMVSAYTGFSYASPGATNSFTNFARPANIAAVQFVSPSTGDYHLSSSSPYSAQNGSATLLSDDGTDVGADIDLVNMATSGAAAGTPPWDQKSGLKPIPGSTQLVFSYQAPTTAVCTATLYNAPARISRNQVTSVADSAASSVSDVLTRQLYISGLTASTHYWYKLSCGGGVLMVGDTLTRATGSGTYQFTFDWSTATAMQYSSSPSMSSPTVLPAATRQFIPVAANSVVYAQVGTKGPISILIAP